MPQYVGYENYLKHWMFEVIRGVAMKRAGGVCEVCQDAPATEVHHDRKGDDRYPPWGAFDTPSQLTAICHACHCKKHNKEPKNV